jgi:predicted nucleotidyltransferase component of viral defense system
MSDKGIEQKVKAKLKKISKDEGIIFNNLLETLFLERVLARVSKSKYREKLIFKGGMCLSQIINLKRGTKDIDFLLKEMDAGEKNLEEVFNDICNIEHNDGFKFSNPVIQQLSLEHKKYPGYRISLVGSLGKIKNKVTVDVGVGDVVLPAIVNVKLLGGEEALFEDSIPLKSYPPEYIFSEKLEAILWLRESNGRMKDYYDCHMMIIENALDKNNLKTAISDTFKTRETKLEFIPESFADGLESRWTRFKTKENLEDENLGEIIKKINSLLEELELI